MNKAIILLISALSIWACTPTKENVPVDMTAVQSKSRAKFEPEDGQVLLFVGQELHSIGGLTGYNDGYMDYFKKPAGFTMYTFLNPGSESFGHVHKGLDGIWETSNWGDNESNMTLQLNDPQFQDMALAIGLGMVDHDQAVANGERDELILKLGDFLKSLAPRPVFLRIGYEFGGSWNHYDTTAYKAAYRRIKDKLDAMEVTNVAYVWQSHGYGMTIEQMEAYYPGDEYVDWCGFSFFNYWSQQKMIEMARQKGKPVFIAEASPTITDTDSGILGLTKETILSNPDQSEEAWQSWFVPFFKTINDNPDVVKAISYINCNWRANPMWTDNPTFKGIDARLQTNEGIANKWVGEMSKEKYIHSSPSLYQDLVKK